MKEEYQVYPFQVIGAKFIVDNKRVLLADEMGMYKTSQAIFAKSRMEIENKRRLPTLVICPNSVREHWLREIKRWYYKKDQSQVVMLESDTIRNGIEKAKDADFAIISHPLMSRLGSQTDDRLEKLKKVGFEYLIVDEVHNAKNPLALRSNATKELADVVENLALLGGTPIPNSVQDIYMIMSYLKPDAYPIPTGGQRKLLAMFYQFYKQNPKLVKALLHEKMMRREVKDYIDAKVPQIEMNEVEIPLEGYHRKIYEEVYFNDDLPVTSKFRQLEKVLIDPNLVDPNLVKDKSLRKLLGRLESSRYKKLDEIVEWEAKNGGKVLIYSPHFKVGVTDRLRERYKGFGAVVIDGDVSAYKGTKRESDREKIRKKFQQDPATKVLIATTTMHEGVDLTAATAIVNLDLPYTPADMHQAIRRSARTGEVTKDRVRVYNLIGVFPEREIPTLDEGIKQLLKDKERIINFLMRGYVVTKEDIEKLREPHRTRPIRRVITSPMKVVFDHYFSFRRRSGEGIHKFLEMHPEIAKSIPAYYLMQWEYSLPGNTARIYTQIINALEKVENLDKKVDLASGPNVLSMVSGQPTTSLDIDLNMLKKGKKVKHPDTESIQGLLHLLPFRDNYFDVGVISLSYQMTKPVIKKKMKGKEVKIKERELTLREANRIMRRGGYLILALPYSCISPDDVPRFYEGVDKLGFQVIPELSGYVEGSRPAKRTSGARFKIFLTTLKKYDKPTDEELDIDYFTFFMDKQKFVRGRKKEDWQAYRSRSPKGLIIYGQDDVGRNLDEAIEMYMKNLKTGK